jgi:putative ATP-dependent endonuclease of OLD family
LITKVRIQGYRIYSDFTLMPNPRLNLIVGANETGKSTLMEAIALALTGRINGRRAAEELNPYWFNASLVQTFVRKRAAGKPARLPEIRIEVFFDDRPELQYLCGAINTDVPTTACPGVTLQVLPNAEYTSELEEWAKAATPLLPVEYYTVDWRSFADAVLTSRPRQLATAIIDSRTLRSSSGVDYHMRQILGDHLAPAERAAISLAYRKSNASMSESVFKQVNQRIAQQHASLHDRPIALAMDQRSSWEGAVVPHVDDVPFSMSGQGQQAALKISLAMSRNSTRANFVMVEEPENHLSHTSLTKLLSRMRSLAGDQQQLFVTTHSSFVLNRLGLDALLLMGGGSVSKISGLSPDTVAYFQKLPGYDTLRMALARKVALVEGPSDEIIFERVFQDLCGCRPMEAEIDVLSMRGLSLARCLELCAALDKQVAALRDNDGTDPAVLRVPLKDWLATGKRELFVGEPSLGPTLEPQLIHHNGEPQLRRTLRISDAADLLTWMSREKTEAALRIAESQEALTPPAYMRQAAFFLHG